MDKNAALESGAPSDATAPGSTVLQDGIIALDAMGDVALNGELFSSSEITALSGSDLDVTGGLLTAGEAINLTAGRDGTGSLTGDIRTELLTLNAGGAMTLIAGWLGSSEASPQSPTGDILLTGSLLTATAHEDSETPSAITLQAAGGLISHTGGRIRADTLTTRSASTLTLNTDTREIDAIVSGAGDVAISNIGAVDLTKLHAFDGKITVESFGAITATDVRVLTDNDANDIELTTRLIFPLDGVGGTVPLGNADMRIGAVNAGNQGAVTLHADGDISQLSGEGVTAETLEVRAVGGAAVTTDVARLDLRTLATGEAAIDQSASTQTLTLTGFRVTDGAISITTGGDLIAPSIQSESNRQGNHIALAAGGDVAIDFVGNDSFAATQEDAESLKLRALNTLLRESGVLPDWERDWTITQASALAAIVESPDFPALADRYSDDPLSVSQAKALGVYAQVRSTLEGTETDIDAHARTMALLTLDEGLASLNDALREAGVLFIWQPDWTEDEVATFAATLESLALSTVDEDYRAGALTPATADALHVYTAVREALRQSGDIEAADSETLAILTLSGTLATHADLTITAGGAIWEIADSEDANVDLIARTANLTAGSGIIDLEVAFDEITSASTVTGGIEIRDFDSCDAQITGLEIGSMTAVDDIVVDADGDMIVTNIHATNANASVYLTAGLSDVSMGNVVVLDNQTADAAIIAGSETVLIAGGLITLEDEVRGSERLAFFAGGGPFRVAGARDAARPVLESNVVSITSTEFITVGEIRASDSVALSAGTNVTLQGDIGGIDGGQLANLSIAAAGEHTILVNVLDIDTGMVLYHDEDGKRYLRDVSGSDRYYEGNLSEGDFFTETVGNERYLFDTEIVVQDDTNSLGELVGYLEKRTYYSPDKYYTKDNGSPLYTTPDGDTLVSSEELARTTDVVRVLKNVTDQVTDNPDNKTGLKLLTIWQNIEQTGVIEFERVQVRAESELTLHAARAILGDTVNLALDDPAGVIDISTGQSIHVTEEAHLHLVDADGNDVDISLSTARPSSDEPTGFAPIGSQPNGVALAADGAIRLTTTGIESDIRISGQLADNTGATGEIVLTASRDIQTDESAELLASDYIRLDAEGQLLGDLSLATSGADGVIELISGSAFDLGGATLAADGSIALDAGGDLTLDSANLQGVSGAAPRQVSLNTAADLTVNGGAIAATDHIEMRAADGIKADLNLTATGTNGTIELAAANLDLTSAILTAGKRIAIDAENDLTVDNGNLRSAGGASALEEVSLVAGHNLTVGGAITASQLIRFHAEIGALDADLQLASDTIDLKSGEALMLTEGTTLSAASRIAVESGSHVTLTAGSLEASDGELAEIALIAGGDLDLGGIALAATDLIRLHAAGALRNVDLNLAVPGAGGAIEIASGESLELTDVAMQAADSIVLTTGGGMTLADSTLATQSADGAIELTATGGAIADPGVLLVDGSIIDHATSLIATDTLTATARDGVYLYADASAAAMAVTGSGNIALMAVDNIELQNLTAQNGAIHVATGGTVIAHDVHILTDAHGNDVRIDNTRGEGDIFVSHISAGATLGRVHMESTGIIREIDDHDLGHDISSFYVMLETDPMSGRGKITGHENPNHEIEIDAQDLIIIESPDLIIDEIRDVEIDAEVLGSAHIKTLGRATITHLASGAGEIHIEALGDVTIGYVDAGFQGTLTVKAGGSIYEFDPDAITDLITGELVFSAGGDVGRRMETDLVLETEIAGEARITAGGDARLYQTGGLSIGQADARTGELTLVVSGEVATITGNITANDSVTIVAEGLQVTGSITSTLADVDLNAGDSLLLIEGDIRSGIANGIVEPAGSVTAISQGMQMEGAIVSGAHVFLDTGGGNLLLMGEVSADGAFTVATGRVAIITDDITAAGPVTMAKGILVNEPFTRDTNSTPEFGATWVAAVDNAYSVDENATLTVAASGVLANDGDVEGDALTARIVSDPRHGALAFHADGSFTYTPGASFNGVDSFTYRANDGTANSNLATVSLTVAPVNDAPVVADDSYTEYGSFGGAPSASINGAPGTPDLGVDLEGGNTATPIFSGVGRDGTVVTIFDDANGNGQIDEGEILGTAIVKDGKWTVTSRELGEGIHAIRAIQTDADGNVSSPSDTYFFRVDGNASAASGTPDPMASPDNPSNVAIAAAAAAGVMVDFSTRNRGFDFAISRNTWLGGWLGKGREKKSNFEPLRIQSR